MGSQTPAIIDLNAEAAKLTMFRGRTPQTTFAERKGSVARLGSYRDGILLLGKSAGGKGHWETHPEDELLHILDGARTLDIAEKNGPRSYAVGAGMIDFSLMRATNVHWQAMDVNKDARAAQKGQKPAVLWFTGLSGAGKSTLAEMLFHEFTARGMKTEMLDGDVVRTNLSKGLGFSKEDRDTNIRRIGFVANLLTRNGVATITCAISPYAEIRRENRALIGDFVEVYVYATVEEIAEHRDPKGLYKKALAGEITGFTGVDDPYEAPEHAEITVNTLQQEPIESLQQILEQLRDLGHIDDSTIMVEGDRQHSGMTDLRVTDEGNVAEGR